MKENSKRLKQKFDTFIISKNIFNLKITWLIINLLLQAHINPLLLVESCIVLCKAPSKKKQYKLFLFNQPCDPI